MTNLADPTQHLDEEPKKFVPGQPVQNTTPALSLPGNGYVAANSAGVTTNATASEMNCLIDFKSTPPVIWNSCVVEDTDEED